MALLTEKFHKPENADKVAEGTGWSLYAGGDDWHVSATSAWAVFSSDESNRRLWVKFKFPDGCVWDDGEPGSAKDENREKCKRHSEKAWRTWVREAKKAHTMRNHGSRSWLSAFKTALYSKEMKPFVDEHGEETTRWDEVEEGAARIVNKLLEDELDDPERYIDQAGYRRFVLTFDFGAGEGQRQFPIDVPRYLLTGMSYEAETERVERYAKEVLKDDVTADDWTWLVEIIEEYPEGGPVDPVAEALEPDEVDPQHYIDQLQQKNFSMKSPVAPGDDMTSPCRVVLKHSLSSRKGMEEWVTRLENMQTGGEFSGHYTRDGYAVALTDYKARCAKLGVDWKQSETFSDE